MKAASLPHEGGFIALRRRLHQSSKAPSKKRTERFSKDDVLTVLIHLGCLSFDPDKSEFYIPNKEVRIEMTNAVEASGWKLKL